MSDGTIIWTQRPRLETRHRLGVAFVTVLDKSARKDGTFSRDDFIYDHERDVYVCPGGKELTADGHTRE